MIKYIVISLCDNDFGSAFRGYMETLKRVLTYDPDISKEKLKKIIWEGIMFHVIAYSAHYDENYENKYDRLKSYFEYNMQIFFNEKAMIFQ